eukprot:scaffold120545_cov51-Phaeocystis_antarctica.AAC.1
MREGYDRQLAAAAEAKRVALERLRAELTGSAEEQAAAREAREREGRVEALAGKAMKRIKNAGIIAGWTAWQGQWEEAARQKRMLAGAAARLARPQLAACIEHWRQIWEAVRRAAILQQAGGQAQQLQQSERRREAAEAELAQLHEDHERQLAAAAEAKRVALERLRAELTGTAEEQAAAREATERQQRVEALAGKAMKRIQNAGIIAGWTAWQGQWEEAARQKRMLAGAATRLARPALAAAVAHWRQDWEATRLQEERSKRKSATGASKQQMQELQQVKRQLAAAQSAQENALERQRDELTGSAKGNLAMQAEKAKDMHESLEEQLKDIHAGHAQQLAAAAEAKRVALERLRAELTGTAEEQAAAREARERTGRVEALAGKAMKRIKNAGILAGWGAWHEQWEVAARQKRMLAAAGARLARPALAAAVAHWRADWDAARAAAATKDLSRDVELLKEAAAQQREQHARQLAAAAQAQSAALERLRAELTGSAEEQAAAREARERDGRVEALAGKAMKRIQNAGIIAGWTAWQGQWEEAAWQKRMLAGAAARLARPQLAACMAHWREDWEAEGKAAVAQERKAERSAHVAQLGLVQCPMPNAQRSMPNAQCPIAQCPTPNAQCPMPNAQCPMPNAQRPMPNA